MSFFVTAADILLPAKGIDLEKFACIACDQFTSQREYWEELERFVGDSPSALRLILPEVYLSEGNLGYIERINSAMESYLRRGIFEEHKGCMVYVERSTPYAGIRRGLVAAIDLEAYSFEDGAKTLIRTSEGTVLSRIPPRVEIRKKAPLELPHIMILIDDEERSVIEPLQGEGLELLYDTKLNMGGGSVRGYKVTACDAVIERLKKLAAPDAIAKKYGSEENMAMAVGDGNHSLATAKAIWEQIKPGLSEEEKKSHPARFALAEIVNIYDEGVHFHPIHRVFFVEDGRHFAEGLKRHLKGFPSKGEIIFDGRREEIPLPGGAAEAVTAVQEYADACIKESGGEVDYIHGEDAVLEICKRRGAVGVLLPPINKNSFFEYIIKQGSFPRKTFSIGEACEKRYYIEARRIRR